MLKRLYLLALVCYLAIPAVMICGAGVVQLIDPEMARGRATYVRDYQFLNLARTGALWAAAGLAGVLWVVCCYLVLESRRRSLRWLSLAAAGPLGFGVIAALEDRSPAPGDLYQRVITKLKPYWRVPLELAVFVGVWTLAYNVVVLGREVLIRLESARTGTPIATIVAQQAASSGMWAGGELLEQMYLVPLLYLLWPVVFTAAGWLFTRR